MRSWRSVGAGLLAAGLCVAPAATGAAQAAPDSAAGRVVIKPTPRVAALIGKMTLDEKLSFVSSKVDPAHLGEAGYIPGVARLGIPELRLADGPVGIRVNEHATALPAPVALASSFDEHLAHEYGRVMGRDGRALGQDVVLAPMTNTIRVPYAGRNFETFSEDPLVNARMVSGEIRGIQSAGLMATVKHFAANNQETNRQGVNVHVDERTLREIELPGFEAAVDAGVASVMCAYNRVNGPYACGNDELLNGILKAEWGFRGWVMSDWGATHATTDLLAGLDQNMFLAGAQPSPFFEEPLKQAVLDGSVPVAALNDAVARILGQMERFNLLDGAATHRPTRDRTGGARVAQRVAEAGAVLLKNSDAALPLGAANRDIAVIGPTAKNPKYAGGGSSNVIPDSVAAPLDTISQRAGKDATVTYVPGGDTTGVAIPLEDSPLGPDGSLTVTPPDRANFTRTLNVPADGEYIFSVDAPGAFATVTVDGKLIVRNSYASLNASAYLTAGPHTVTITGTPLQGVPATLKYRWITPEAVKAARDQAVEAARHVDTAIVFAYDLGLEGVDRPSLSLPFSQNELISEIADVNPNTIVVLNAGSSVLMPWLPKVKAVLDMYYPGQNGAEATARLLFGDVTPQGKLTQTFPASEDAHPVAGDPEAFPGVNNEQTYKEGLYVGYRWYDNHDVTPLFPFGHGLSYTSFTYGRLDAANLNRGAKSTRVRVLVKNTGQRRGTETVQVYVGHLPTATETEEQQLAGFAKVTLKPGQQQYATARIDRRTLSYWDTDADRWVTPTGDVPVYVGSSSRDIRLSGHLTVR